MTSCWQRIRNCLGVRREGGTMERLYDDLPVYAIHLDELTPQEANRILRNWKRKGDESPLEEMTLAYVNGRLLLNKDHDWYEYVEKCVRRYLAKGYQSRNWNRWHYKSKMNITMSMIIDRFIHEQRHKFGVIKCRG